jgi:Tol biopolymer transport system component
MDNRHYTSFSLTVQLLTPRIHCTQERTTTVKARIPTTLLLASTMLVTQMTTSLPGAALDLARPAQPMEVAIHTGRIAFASDRDENWEVYTMNADGTDQTRLTDDWRLDYGPISSPDGEHIAFVPDRFVSELRTDGEIYVMKADDSEVRNLNQPQEGRY